MKAFGKSEREIWVGIGLSVGITLTMMAVYGLGGFHWLELHTYDMRMSLRGTQSVKSPILLVLNDEQTLTHLGIAPSRVTRTHYAHAIQHLRHAKARLIVLDVIFADRGDPDENHLLANAMAQAGNVVLARYIGPEQTMVPLPVFQHAAIGEGLINIMPDSDGVLRSMPLLGVGYQQDQLRTFFTLGAEAGRLYLDPDGVLPLNVDTPGLARLGEIGIPIEHNTTLINFTGPSGTFSSLPFWQIVKGEFPPDQVNGKIVLIGSSAATMQDFHLTPLAQKETTTLKAQSATISGTRMPGVEVHANLLNMFLTQQFITHSSPSLVYLVMGTVGLLCGLLVTLIPKGELGVILGVIGLLGSLIGLSIFLFIHHNYWLDTVPLIAIINGHFALATAYQRYLVVRQKNHLRAMLSEREKEG
ncbi:MAG: CHASE2 domain-containing protein [Nitrospirae bacterium]|nr:CHASE2 domain-containing protein [Nitrospirota bacterium]